MSETLNDSLYFLEATHDKAQELLDFHNNRRAPWTVAEIREKHDYPKLLYEVTRRLKNEEPFELPEGVNIGLYITLLTENGIVWYPREVGEIFNPTGKKPSENDPHAQFGRTWTSEEFPHGEGLIDCLWLTGIDMVKYEKDRSAFQYSDAIPGDNETPEGVAYTGTQELSTDKPYRNLTNILKDTINTTSDQLVRDVCSFIKDIVSHISADERMHAKFINGLGAAAIDTKDPRTISLMLRGAANRIIDFAMPGDPGIPNFRRLALKAARLGIFTPRDLAEIKVKQIDETWNVLDQSTLNAEGEIARATLLDHRTALLDKYPELSNES